MLKFVEKILTTKKNVAKNKSIAGENITGNQVADSIVNINSSDLTALMKRQEQLRNEKWIFGYSERNQRELENVEKAIQECVKAMGRSNSALN